LYLGGQRPEKKNTKRSVPGSGTVYGGGNEKEKLKEKNRGRENYPRKKSTGWGCDMRGRTSQRREVKTPIKPLKKIANWRK